MVRMAKRREHHTANQVDIKEKREMNMNDELEKLVILMAARPIIEKAAKLSRHKSVTP